MKTIFRLSALFLIFVLASCSKTEDETLPKEPVTISLSDDQVSIVNSTNDFAFDIFSKVTMTSGDENIIISPLSISTALSMTVNGASGQTREAMMQALRKNGLTNEVLNHAYKELVKALTTVDRRVAISIANSVWTEKSFTAKKQFIDALNDFYDAEARTFDISDPGAAAAVNKWIEDNTSGLIRNMLDRIDPDAVMLLINAIYFKGQWKAGFDIANTSDGTFHLLNGNSAQVKMMKQKEEFKAYKGNGFSMVELPYGQGNYVMDVILPDDTKGINNILRDIDSESFNSYLENLTVTEVQLSLPRFKYSYRKSLNDILTDMGMGIAFSEYDADFSGISDLQLYINRVLHQAFIETNEQGTEAAAATIVEIGVTSMPLVFVMNVDRPFIYFIREITTNSVIFMGKVMNPLES